MVGKNACKNVAGKVRARVNVYPDRQYFMGARRREKRCEADVSRAPGKRDGGWERKIREG